MKVHKHNLIYLWPCFSHSLTACWCVLQGGRMYVGGQM